MMGAAKNVKAFEWHDEEFKCYSLCCRRPSKLYSQGIFLIETEGPDRQQNRG